MELVFSLQSGTSRNRYTNVTTRVNRIKYRNQCHTRPLGSVAPNFPKTKKKQKKKSCDVTFRNKAHQYRIFR